MAIGLHRAGVGGLLAAWVGFTLPSALLLVGFAFGIAALGDLSQAGWVLGLKSAAVAVVAHAVLGMTRSLAPDAKRASIAVGAMILVLLVPSPLTQFAAVAAAGLVGMIWLERPVEASPTPPVPRHRVPRAAAIACLAAFVTLLVGLPVLAASTGSGIVALFDLFYRAGSLVFGGGHVVLPLLQAETVQTGLVDPESFLAGYGAAQAVPGPLFTFAAFLGAVSTGGPSGLLGAAVALVAVFLPSALLLVGALPFWERLRQMPRARTTLMGVNAGVVGLLAAALYTPVFTEGIGGPGSLAIAAAGFVALTAWRAPAWSVVAASALLGSVLL